MSRTDAILKRLLALHPKLIDLDLKRIQVLLEALGRPQDRLPPVIHVAGTNGKGSTVALLRAMLEAGGYKVHTYTSPHLVRFNERIRLAGSLVSSRRLNDALELCERANAGQPMTFFEITTAAAFHLFAETPADFLLLEVGLGGEFDATNVIDKPLGAVITPLGIDHQQFLGNTLAEIAVAKAGILKRGAPAVVAAQPDEARAVIDRRAARLGIRPCYAGEDFSGGEEDGHLVYRDEHGLLDLPPPALAGAHQFDNASLAIAAIRHFGIKLPESAIAEGLRRVTWPARLARLTGKLAQGLGPDQELWLDGGHNTHGTLALVRALDSMQARRAAPLVLIVGMLNTRTAVDLLAPFAGRPERIFTLTIPGEPNARKAADIAAAARSVGFDAEARRSLGAALADARAIPGARILICGSLYLAGFVLDKDGTRPQ